MATEKAAPKDVKREEDTADFGDFVSNDDEELDLEEVVEPWHKYDSKETPRAFYPIFVGEVIHERYLVEHKLGAGGFSTVWMAHDLVDQRDVALKVMSKGEWGDHEIRLQDEIIKNVSDTSHLVTYLATFLLPGNECQHRVFVFDLRGPYLCINLVGKLAMTSRMSAAKQLLEAVGHLHQAGIIHRDLNERNCMWGMSPLHDQGRSAKYRAFGRPLKQPIPFVDDLWKRGELVSPMVIPETLRTEDFYLGDFGLAMKTTDSQIQRGYPPSQFCSPDRLHGKHPSFACDMWSYMVLFTELYIGFPPFATFLPGGVVSGMVRCLGPLPSDWKGQCDRSDALDEWYDPGTRVDPNHDLAATIRYYRPDVEDVEMRLVLAFMQRVFTYVPEERLSARELMGDPSFIAIMEKYGVDGHSGVVNRL